MGEIADLMIDGFLDSETGEVLDGDSPGYPRTKRKRRKKKKKKNGTRIQAMPNENVERIAVNRDVLEALLDTLRDGEAQVVTFSMDNGVMACRAAELSKRKCAEAIEVVTAILAGEDVVLSRRDDEDE